MYRLSFKPGLKPLDKNGAAFHFAVKPRPRFLPRFLTGGCLLFVLLGFGAAGVHAQTPLSLSVSLEPPEITLMPVEVTLDEMGNTVRQGMQGSERSTTRLTVALENLAAGESVRLSVQVSAGLDLEDIRTAPDSVVDIETQKTLTFDSANSRRMVDVGAELAAAPQATLTVSVVNATLNAGRSIPDVPRMIPVSVKREFRFMVEAETPDAEGRVSLVAGGGDQQVRVWLSGAELKEGEEVLPMLPVATRIENAGAIVRLAPQVRTTERMAMQRSDVVLTRDTPSRLFELFVEANNVPLSTDDEVRSVFVSFAGDDAELRPGMVPGIANYLNANYDHTHDGVAQPSEALNATFAQSDGVEVWVRREFRFEFSLPDESGEPGPPLTSLMLEQGETRQVFVSLSLVGPGGDTIALGDDEPVFSDAFAPYEYGPRTNLTNTTFPTDTPEAMDEFFVKWISRSVPSQDLVGEDFGGQTEERHGEKDACYQFGTNPTDKAPIGQFPFPDSTDLFVGGGNQNIGKIRCLIDLKAVSSAAADSTVTVAQLSSQTADLRRPLVFNGRRWAEDPGYFGNSDEFHYHVNFSTLGDEAAFHSADLRVRISSPSRKYSLTFDSLEVRLGETLPADFDLGEDEDVVMIGVPGQDTTARLVLTGPRLAEGEAVEVGLVVPGATGDQARGTFTPSMVRFESETTDVVVTLSTRESAERHNLSLEVSFISGPNGVDVDVDVVRKVRVNRIVTPVFETDTLFLAVNSPVNVSVATLPLLESHPQTEVGFPGAEHVEQVSLALAAENPAVALKQGGVAVDAVALRGEGGQTSTAIEVSVSSEIMPTRLVATVEQSTAVLVLDEASLQIEVVDPVVLNQAPSLDVEEGETVEITVRAPAPAAADLTVGYEIVGDGVTPADTDDYRDDTAGAGTGTVTIPAGGMTADISIFIHDDEEIEPPQEGFRVLLTAPPAGARYAIGHGPDSASTVTVTIKEGVCDRTPQVQRVILAAVVPPETVCTDVTGEQLPLIQSLAVDDAGVTALKSKDFDRVIGLRTLSVSGNPGLTALPSEIFHGLPLTALSLDGNGLTGLPTGIFSRVSALVSLSLHDNQLTELPANIFSGVNVPQNLISLDLSGNELASLRADAFSRLTKLQKLDLSTNRFTALAANTFSNLDALQELYLGNNPLEGLPAGIFSPLTALSGLHLPMDDDGNPLLALTVGHERLDTADLEMMLDEGEFRLTVEQGAPFEVNVGLAGNNAAVTLAGASVDNAPIGRGSVRTETLIVTQTLAASPGTVTATWPAAPADVTCRRPSLSADHACYQGVAFSSETSELVVGDAPRPVPTVTGVAFISNPAGGSIRYFLNETIRLRVTFSEAVTVTPSLDGPVLVLGNFDEAKFPFTTTRAATYTGLSDATTAVFEYTVAAADRSLGSANGVTLDASVASDAAAEERRPLKLEGARIASLFGVPADLTLSGSQIRGISSVSQNHRVGGLHARPGFSPAHTNSDSPLEIPAGSIVTVSLEIGGIRQLPAGRSVSLDLAIGTGAQDGAFQIATLDGEFNDNEIELTFDRDRPSTRFRLRAAPDATVGTRRSILADVDSPYVGFSSPQRLWFEAAERAEISPSRAAIVSFPENRRTIDDGRGGTTTIEDAYAVDETIRIEVGFDEAVSVSTATGSPSLLLTIGDEASTADFVRAEDQALIFEYTVQLDDYDSDGVSIAHDALILGGASVADGDGRQVSPDLTGLEITNAADHKVAGRRFELSFEPPRVELRAGETTRFRVVLSNIERLATPLTVTFAGEAVITDSAGVVYPPIEFTTIRSGDTATGPHPAVSVAPVTFTPGGEASIERTLTVSSIARVRFENLTYTFRLASSVAQSVQDAARALAVPAALPMNVLPRVIRLFFEPSELVFQRGAAGSGLFLGIHAEPDFTPEETPAVTVQVSLPDGITAFFYGSNTFPLTLQRDQDPNGGWNLNYNDPQPGTITMSVTERGLVSEFSTDLVLSELPVRVVDPPVASVVPGSRTVEVEEDQTAMITVMVNEAPLRNLNIAYTIEPGSGDSADSAADASDYGDSTGGTVTIRTGETTADIMVPITDDDAIEPTRETFRVNLAAREGANFQSFFGPGNNLMQRWVVGTGYTVEEGEASSAIVLIKEGVCDRTASVGSAIVGATGASDCADVDDEGLTAVTGPLEVMIEADGGAAVALQQGDFWGLTNLQTLKLSSPALSISLSGDVFRDPEGNNALPGLTTLDLSANGIGELPPGVFAGFDSLTTLDLRGNMLTAGDLARLEGLAALRVLNLSDNASLTSLDTETLAGLSNLRSLFLDGTGLTNLPVELLVGLGLNELSLPPAAPLVLEFVETDGSSKPASAQVLVRLVQGAPFDVPVGFSTENATLSLRQVTIPEGTTRSEIFTVTRVASNAPAIVTPSVAEADIPATMRIAFRSRADLVLGGTEPSALSITSNPAAGGAYAAGETITAQVQFGANVTVALNGGAVTLTVQIGNEPREMTLAGTSGDTLTFEYSADTLTFEYMVTTWDYDSDGVSIGAAALGLSGGAAITDSVGQQVAPALTGLEITNAAGHQVKGRRLSLALTFETPDVEAGSFTTATLTLGSAVAGADLTGLLDAGVEVAVMLAADAGLVAPDVVTLTRDAPSSMFRVHAALDAYEAGPPQPLGLTASVGQSEQDRVEALVTGDDGNLTVTQRRIRVVWEPAAVTLMRSSQVKVKVASAPILQTGEVIHVTPSPSDHLSFFDESRNALVNPVELGPALASSKIIVIRVSDDAPDGSVMVSLTSEAGTDVGEAALDVSAVLAVTIAVPLPVVSDVGIVGTPTDGEYYAAGETVRVRVTFSDNVTVTDAPALVLTVGGETRDAVYSAAESNATELVFDYEVVEEDYDSDGVSVSDAALELRGGTILDNADRAVNRALGERTFAAAKVAGRRLSLSFEPVSVTLQGGAATRVNVVLGNADRLTGDLTVTLRPDGGVTVNPDDVTFVSGGDDRIEITVGARAGAFGAGTLAAEVGQSVQDSVEALVSDGTLPVTIETRVITVSFTPNPVVLGRGGAARQVTMAASPAPEPGEQFSVSFTAPSSITASGNTILGSGAQARTELTLTALADAVAGMPTVAASDLSLLRPNTAVRFEQLQIDVVDVVSAVLPENVEVVQGQDATFTVGTNPALVAGQSATVTLTAPSGSGLLLSSGEQTDRETLRLALTADETERQVTVSAAVSARVGASLTVRSAVSEAVGVEVAVPPSLTVNVTAPQVGVEFDPAGELVLTAGEERLVTLTLSAGHGLQPGQEAVLNVSVTGDGLSVAPPRVTLTAGEQATQVGVTGQTQGVKGTLTVTAQPGVILEETKLPVRVEREFDLSFAPPNVILTAGGAFEEVVLALGNVALLESGEEVMVTLTPSAGLDVAPLGGEESLTSVVLRPEPGPEGSVATATIRVRANLAADHLTGETLTASVAPADLPDNARVAEATLAAAVQRREITLSFEPGEIRLVRGGAADSTTERMVILKTDPELQETEQIVVDLSANNDLAVTAPTGAVTLSAMTGTVVVTVQAVLDSSDGSVTATVDESASSFGNANVETVPLEAEVVRGVNMTLTSEWARPVTLGGDDVVTIKAGESTDITVATNPTLEGDEAVTVTVSVVSGLTLVGAGLELIDGNVLVLTAENPDATIRVSTNDPNLFENRGVSVDGVGDRVGVLRDPAGQYLRPEHAILAIRGALANEVTVAFTPPKVEVQQGADATFNVGTAPSLGPGQTATLRLMITPETAGLSFDDGSFSTTVALAGDRQSVELTVSAGPDAVIGDTATVEVTDVNHPDIVSVLTDARSQATLQVATPQVAVGFTPDGGVLGDDFSLNLGASKSVELSLTNFTLSGGQTATFSVSVEGSGLTLDGAAPDGTVEVTLNADNATAEVTVEAAADARSAGRLKVRAVSGVELAGGAVAAELAIEVLQPVTLSFSPADVVIQRGRSATFDVTITPRLVADRSVTVTLNISDAGFSFADGAAEREVVLDNAKMTETPTVGATAEIGSMTQVSVAVAQTAGVDLAALPALTLTSVTPRVTAAFDAAELVLGEGRSGSVEISLSDYRPVEGQTIVLGVSVQGNLTAAQSQVSLTEAAPTAEVSITAGAPGAGTLTVTADGGAELTEEATLPVRILPLVAVEFIPDAVNVVQGRSTQFTVTTNPPLAAGESATVTLTAPEGLSFGGERTLMLVLDGDSTPRHEVTVETSAQAQSGEIGSALESITGGFAPVDVQPSLTVNVSLPEIEIRFDKTIVELTIDTSDTVTLILRGRSRALQPGQEAVLNVSVDGIGLSVAPRRVKLTSTAPQARVEVGAGSVADVSGTLTVTAHSGVIMERAELPVRVVRAITLSFNSPSITGEAPGTGVPDFCSLADVRCVHFAEAPEIGVTETVTLTVAGGTMKEGERISVALNPSDHLNVSTLSVTVDRDNQDDSFPISFSLRPEAAQTADPQTLSAVGPEVQGNLSVAGETLVIPSPRRGVMLRIRLFLEGALE